MSAAAFLLLAGGLLSAPTKIELAKGVTYAEHPVLQRPALGDGILRVVRIRPGVARLTVHMAPKGGNLTAQSWMKELGAQAVINAGMFHGDHRTHVGYCRAGSRLNSADWNHYRAVFFSHPSTGAFAWCDRTRDGGCETSPFEGTPYDKLHVVQNLRIQSGAGRLVWRARDKQWSEAALGMTAEGDVLLLHLRSPTSMPDFARAVKRAIPELRGLMHLEGGPEASLSVATQRPVHMSGSFETGFMEDDSNRQQWPLPVVLAVQ